MKNTFARKRSPDKRAVSLSAERRQASMPENPVEHIWGYWKKPELPNLCR